VTAAALGLLAANLPDLDFLPGLLAGNPSRWHHAWTHSLAFAGLVSVCIWAVAVLLTQDRGRAARWALTGGLLVVLHHVLDLFTGDPSPPFGIPLLWPVSDGWYLSPWTPLADVRRGSPNPELVRHWVKLALTEGLLGGALLAGAAGWRRHDRKRAN
jgi:membrane-bound metal-dependent hydrolase YbcI (DUF457 family)